MNLKEMKAKRQFFERNELGWIYPLTDDEFVDLLDIAEAAQKFEANIDEVRYPALERGSPTEMTRFALRKALEKIK
jgi:hypothetical protein